MVCTQRLGEHGVLRHRALHRENLLAGARAKGNAVGTRRSLQRPERAGLIRIGLGVGQVARSLLLFDEHAAVLPVKVRQ